MALCVIVIVKGDMYFKLYIIRYSHSFLEIDFYFFFKKKEKKRDLLCAKAYIAHIIILHFPYY